MSKTNKQDEPSILYFDIETLPYLLSGFRIGNKVKVGHEQIRKEMVVCVICYAWGDGKVQSLSFNPKLYDKNKYDDDSDKELLKLFSEIYNKADVVVAHNGKNFDISVMRARIIKHQLPDIAPVLVDDTLLQTKSIRFASHKLDYIDKYLGGGGKREHSGLKMWHGIMDNEKKYLSEMIKYCKQDIVGLRRDYKKLLPYIKPINQSIFKRDPEACPKCGKVSSYQVRGSYYAVAGEKSRIQYKCGHWSIIGKNNVKKSGQYPR